jgi:hypothetical protein
MAGEDRPTLIVIAGLVPAISLRRLRASLIEMAGTSMPLDVIRGSGHDSETAIATNSRLIDRRLALARRTGLD